jgi:rod shape-determining protein MreD
MRFFPWLILAYVVLGLQSGLAPYIQVYHASPNLVLPVVIFIALYAPKDSALLGTYVVGLMQDMLSAYPLGTLALVYAPVTLLVRVTQPVIHREHWMTHLVLAVVGGAIQGVVITLVGIRTGARPPVSILAISTVYTAALAPVMLRPLHRMRKLFAFAPERKLPGRA